MKTVKEIYDFFQKNTGADCSASSLMDFFETVPCFKVCTKDSSGLSSMNMSLAMEYLKICEKMCDDFLLLRVKEPSVIGIDGQYIAVHSVNSSDPAVFRHEIDYGKYDFKYRGFPYTRDTFQNSVLPIVGINRKTQCEDLGTAYYIGDNYFVTAAHCVKGLTHFNLLLPDNSPLVLKEVWYAKGENIDDYDLAVLHTDKVPNDIKSFELNDPNVLDDVLTMGYPPIPGLNPVLISEKASVASYVKGRQKSSTGQIVAQTDSYLSKLDFFIISARVKGGNSGCPVISNDGYVVGTVFQIPFDSKHSSNPDEERYDIMGYGVCLPSKYTRQLMDNPEIHPLKFNEGGYDE